MRTDLPLSDSSRRANWRRMALALLWLGLLALLATWVASTLRVTGDLRLFMPEPKTDDQRLMMQQLGEGPGARLLLLALSGAEPEVLAERSRMLRAALEDAPELVWVGNGEDGLESIPAALQDYRYVLSPGPVEGSLAPTALRAALQERLQDLASPAATMIAPLMAHDPTLETLRVVQAWTPSVEPERFDGVWFSRDQRHALLLAETRAAGFDPNGQQIALNRLREAHAAALEGGKGTLEISGPGAFSERMAAQTSGEAGMLGSVASVGLLLLLGLAHRSVSLPLLGGLPLASGAIAGLVATTALFGEVHGITLAFGFTLLGVAQDYPVHLFSHRQAGRSNLKVAQDLWPTLATGAGSTCMAYLIFLFAGISGLRQLAVFTVSGLMIAALTTRYALPALLGPATRDPASARLVVWMQTHLLQRRRPRWIAPTIAGACALILLFGPAPWWQDDLGTLAPVPSALLQRDGELRAELGAPDVRWLLVVRAADREQALQGSERLSAPLDRLVVEKVLDGYDLAARYLPSQATQQIRRAALPEPQALRSALIAAQVGLPFRSDAFDGFLDAVERARAMPALMPDDLADTPLHLRISSLLREQEGETIALVTLSGLHQPEALMAWASHQPGVHLLDLKATAQSLASAWRTQVLWAMVGAALLLALGIRLALGSWRRTRRVLLPVTLGTVIVVATLHLLAIPLTLFHMVSLVLAAGIGEDYALFFEHAGADPLQQRRTLHSLLLCAASTLLVFALLALSTIPVLRAIGATVTLGVLVHFALSLLLVAAPASPGEAVHD